jgi:putative membrane-bound dehydrogenase-like protein
MVSVMLFQLPLPAAETPNIPLGPRGELPMNDDGQPLNFDFEKGTLDDWTAQGEAFTKQPIRGGIDKNRPFGEDKVSLHTGEYWIGGYEKLHDGPRGTLTSTPFTVTHPYASFLVGGGGHAETRVELVRADTNQVFFKASGTNNETMAPAVVDLRPHQGKKIFIRLIDEHQGGWGHVNFDDFRLHAEKPTFREPLVQAQPSEAPPLTVFYPHAGLDAEAAAKAMELQPGFSVQVAAAEPDVQQPIALAIDDRGRLWVAEAFEYPNRAPEGQGRDRILIFEDTNLDGRFDKRTVFAEGLNLVSGIEIGFGGVWVGAAPYLLFIPDKNGDDKPDSAPQVLLDGWGYHDTHETLNAFIWGPDGWLYGCHGVFTHSKVGKPGTPDKERIPINAGIWRYHPTRHTFEVFAQGTSNPWGVDFDDRGQAFCTACVIPHLFHIIQGARYERQAGQHFNPYTFNDIKTIAKHRHYVGNQWNNNDRRRSDELGGGHAHAGAMVYLGGAWPEKYRNQIFMNNIHGNRINMDRLEPQNSGYVGDWAPDFLLTRDQWSQIINLRYGPDGQVWMIDWYDANQCHRPEEGAHDRTNGRVFRVSYNGAKPVAVDLQTATDDELVQFQLHNNDWYVRHARRILAERAAAGKLSGNVAPSLAKLAAEHAEESRRLRGLWALHATNGLTTELAAKFLANDSALVRAWTIQFLTEDHTNPRSDEFQAAFANLAKNDPSPVVRLYLASALQRIPLEMRWDILTGLSSHTEDAADHNLPLMYWYAAEPLAEVDPRRALAWALAAGKNIPLLHEYMVRRLGSDPEKALALLVEGLQTAADDPTRLTFLQGINQALQGRRQVVAPAGWQEAYTSITKSNDPQVTLQGATLAATFGDAKARAKLRTMVADENTPLAQRTDALNALLKVQDAELPALLQKLVLGGQIRNAALRGLAAFDDPQTPGVLLKVYEQLDLPQRRDALATLCSRVKYANELLTAIEGNRVPASHLTADLVRQLRNLGDEALNARIEQAWGAVRETSEDKAKLVADWKALLASPSAPKADLEMGRAVFAKTCAQCHTLFGTGGDVGPDITGSNRANLDYLLTNVLDPSAVMAKEYQPSIIYTAQGRVITGIVKQQDDAALTVRTANETVIVPKDEIDEIQVSPLSMMPDNLLQPLAPREVVSLVSYLQSGGQTPMLATPDNVASFFNGKDLTGWRGDPELWSVENGEIVGKSPGIKKNSFLMSELTVEDFHLTLEVKLTPNTENSGIQFRSRPIEDGQMHGYQADIGAGWWGKLYHEHGRQILWDKPADQHVKVGDWNKYEVVAVGSRVRTFLNGQLCVDLDDPQGERRGIIAVQIHSGGPMEIRFRNLKLELLNKLPDMNQPIPTSLGGKAEGKINFLKHELDNKFRSEGVVTADFNNDGQLDIAAGSVWFEAPDWKMHSVLEQPEEFDPKVYSKSFCNYADDLNGDGRLDLIVVDFPGAPTWWFENPGQAGGPWKRNQCVSVTNNESPTYVDVDFDGQRELLFGMEDGRMGFAEPAADPGAPWRKRGFTDYKAPGTERFSHGLGHSDVNGDGRADVIVPQGWWEAPAHVTETGEAWTFHAASLGEPCSQMYAYDFDGDGDNDILSASAHRYGIWWHENTPEGWKTHEIDKSYAQTHAVVLADINGDGLPDFVTGKRWWAHGGNDPGDSDAAVMFWYELTRQDGKPVWIPHQFDHNSGVGTQFEVADVNRDGLLDVVTSNKRGIFYFEQVRE